MASVELLPSPLPVREDRQPKSPVVVIDSDEEDEGEVRGAKRRRGSPTNENDNSDGAGDVIDLTDGVDGPEPIRFRILPKYLRLTPFNFSDDDYDEEAAMPLATLREHLQNLFGIRQPSSPINPDELEITGVKESTNNNNNNNNTTTTTTTTTSSSSSSSSSSSPTSDNNNNNNNKKNKRTRNDNKKETQPPPPPPEDKGLRINDCPVCLEPPTNARMTQCGHVFCDDCLKRSLIVTKSCPYCKQKMTIAKSFRIYSLSGTK